MVLLVYYIWCQIKKVEKGGADVFNKSLELVYNIYRQISLLKKPPVEDSNNNKRVSHDKSNIFFFFLLINVIGYSVIDKSHFFESRYHRV